MEEETNTFTPEEITFFAQDEVVSIVPNFSLHTEGRTCVGISGEWGPFTPNRECGAPLWLALALWQRKRCSIRPPGWMDPARLEEALEAERGDRGAFSPLPFYYAELAHCLFTGGAGEALGREVFGPRLAEVKELVDALQRVRRAKVEEGLRTIQRPGEFKLNNLAAVELNLVRGLLLGFLDRLDEVAAMEPDDGGAGAGAGSQLGGGGGGAGQGPARQLRRGAS